MRERAERRGKTSGDEHRAMVHPGALEDRGVDEHDVGHGEEGRDPGAKLGRDARSRPRQAEKPIERRPASRRFARRDGGLLPSLRPFRFAVAIASHLSPCQIPQLRNGYAALAMGNLAILHIRRALLGVSQMTAGQFLLVLLTLWGLAMIVPDVVRVARPLASIGLFADGDGLIVDVIEPFPNEAASPAWRAGVRAGDRLDLEAMRCRPGRLDECSSSIAVLGGVEYLLPGRTVTLDFVATDRAPARQVVVTAAQPPSNFLVRTVNFLCQIAGILVVLGAAWLVWTRPSAMSWGFFLYVNWFNPGPGPCLLCLARAQTRALPRASRGDGLGRGHRLRRVPALRAARAEQQDGSEMARLRTRSAGGGPRLRARSGRLLWQPVRLSRRDGHARFDPHGLPRRSSPRSPSFSPGRERRRRRIISASAG